MVSDSLVVEDVAVEEDSVDVVEVSEDEDSLVDKDVVAADEVSVDDSTVLVLVLWDDTEVGDLVELVVAD